MGAAHFLLGLKVDTIIMNNHWHHAKRCVLPKSEFRTMCYQELPISCWNKEQYVLFSSMCLPIQFLLHVYISGFYHTYHSCFLRPLEISVQHGPPVNRWTRLLIMNADPLTGPSRCPYSRKRPPTISCLDISQIPTKYLLSSAYRTRREDIDISMFGNVCFPPRKREQRTA